MIIPIVLVLFDVLLSSPLFDQFSPIMFLQEVSPDKKRCHFPILVHPISCLLSQTLFSFFKTGNQQLPAGN